MKQIFWFAVVIGIGAYIFNRVSENQEQARIEESAAIQASVWQDLHEYKVDHHLNRAGMKSDLLPRAENAHAIHESDESAGLLALVAVWQHRWHFRNAEWRLGLFAEDDKLTKRALAGRPTPSAFLARAWLLSNACTIMPKTHPDRRTVCLEAIETYTKAQKNLAGSTMAWLHFESLWTEVQFMNRYMERFKDEVSPGLFRSRSNLLCDQGAEIIDSSPVNDVELAVQCTVAAANTQQWARYFNAVVLHLQAGEREGKYSNRSVSSAFTAADVGCTSLQATTRHRLTNRYPIPFGAKNSAHAFCIVAGYTAVGCFEFGHDIWRQYDGKGTQDWAGLKRAIGRGLSAGHGRSQRCVYTDQVHGRRQLEARVRLKVGTRAARQKNPVAPGSGNRPPKKDALDEIEDMFGQPDDRRETAKAESKPSPSLGAAGVSKDDDAWLEYE